MTRGGLFLGGTGTGVGKTFVAAALARALVKRDIPTAAVKPVETGCAPDAKDACHLAEACGTPRLTTLPGFYRARAALSPFAATLQGEPAPPSVALLVEATFGAASQGEVLLVESAGGLLTPLDERNTMADLAVALRLPICIVVPDVLGTISQTMACVEAAERRGLTVRGVALNSAFCDASTNTNARVLERLLQCRILSVGDGFPTAADLLDLLSL